MELRLYARELATRGELNLSTLSKETANSLAAAGIGKADLQKIAGADEVIRGGEFEKIFSLLEARAEKSGGGNVGRAQKVYESLSKELDRNAAAAVAPKNAGFARAGLRDEMTAAKGPPRAPEFSAVDLPEVASDRKTPDKPSWFARLLEAIFDFLPGVTTDTDRLKSYGRDLADRHGSEIVGFRAAHERDAKMRGPFNAVDVALVDQDAAMTEHLAQRFQQEHGISETEAYDRARVVVAAMNQQLDKRLAAGAASLGPLPQLDDDQRKAARTLAGVDAIVKEEVDKSGPRWAARYQRAMATPPPDHAHLANAGKNREQLSNQIKVANLEMLAFAMALEKGGKLENIPPSGIDGLLDAHFSGKVGNSSVANAISGLDAMSSKEDGNVYAKLGALPPDLRAIGYQVLAKEHLLLQSKDPVERAGAIARVVSAADQLATKDPVKLAQAKQAFEEERLGLEQQNVTLQHTVGGKSVTTTLPVYFHPAISADKKAHYAALIKEAYQHLPGPLVAEMLKGEHGKGTHVQVLPHGAIYPEFGENVAPRSLLSFFDRDRNTVQLNTHQIDALETREEAVTMVLHESAHLVDDLGHPDQTLGFFINRGDQEAGELAPSMKHFETQRSRYDELVGNFDDPTAVRYHQLLSKGERRTDAEDKTFRALEKTILARSGSVSQYGAHGGNEQGGKISEWYAETYAHYANPATRGHLRSVDPVAHRAMARIHADLEKGVSTTDAMRSALRFSLSTDVAAQQGRTILAKGVSQASLEDLGGITTAFEEHGKSLEGWKPFGGDAALKQMRRGEAIAGVASGKALLTDVRASLATLPSGADKTKLAAIEKRLAKAIDALEVNAGKI